MAVDNKGYSYTLLSPMFRIKSNVRLPYELEDEESPLTTGPSEVEITFNVADDLPVFICPQDFEFCFGEWDADQIYFEVTLGGPIKAKMRMRGLLSKNVEVLVNKTYYRVLKQRIGQVEPPEKHIGDIIIVKLLERNFALIHGATVCSDGEGIVMVAPPNTGKSLSTVLALGKGFNFISEDTAITDGEYVYPFELRPSTTLVSGLEPRQKSTIFKIKLINLIHSKLRFMPYIMRTPSFNLSSLGVPVTERAKIRWLFFLARGKREVVELDKQEAMRRILVLSRREFNYYENKVLLVYSYLNPALNLTRLMETEEKVLTYLIDNHPCFLCTADNPREYIELIEQVVNL